MAHPGDEVGVDYKNCYKERSFQPLPSLSFKKKTTEKIRKHDSLSLTYIYCIYSCIESI